MVKKIKILAIAPYPGMSELLTQISQTRQDAEITVRLGNLNDGLDIAENLLQHNSYDVILSRGGTAELLKKSLSAFVVEIPLSVYDILRCIKMAQNYGGKFAIAGFSGITSNAKILCDLLQIDTKIVTFFDEKDVLPVLQDLKASGFSLVICDQIGQMTAQTIGMNSIFIPSGTESINQAIDEAINYVSASSIVFRQKQLLKKALLADQNSHMIFRASGELLLSSVKEASAEARIKDICQKYISSVRLCPHQQIIKKIAGSLYEINIDNTLLEDESFILFTISRKKRLFEESDHTISVYDNVQEASSVDNAIGNNSANLVGEVRTLIERYAATPYPIVITGESGTGKTKAAELLYAGGKFSTRPYYTINCRLMTKEKWDQLLNDECSPLGNNGVTINFLDLQAVTSAQFSLFCNYITDTSLLKRNRMIFSILLPGTDAVAMRDRLANHFSCLSLNLLPLRERVNDIPSISTIYLNRINENLGKQIIGFQPAAMELMKNYSWPGNLNQFHRIIKELAAVTNGSYISEGDVRRLLEQENMHSSDYSIFSKDAFAVNLNQPLDSINKDIVSRVLQEEKMSKEAAAKRLGISRTTLWRMLKSSSDTDK